MNKKIAKTASLLNLLSVSAFAISMIFGNHFISYLSSSFIALSFVGMMASFCFYANQEDRLCGYLALGFSAIYATIILLVYYAQLTTVLQESLSEQASSILSFEKFGLFFNYDMLGYAMMSLATFFAGFLVEKENSEGKILRLLLIFHDIFFVSCYFFPMLGLFQTFSSGSAWIGTVVLEVWCLYFMPVGVLSHRYFSKK